MIFFTLEGHNTGSTNVSELWARGLAISPFVAEKCCIPEPLRPRPARSLRGGAVISDSFPTKNFTNNEAAQSS